jgi:hypothetical protein
MSFYTFERYLFYDSSIYRHRDIPVETAGSKQWRYIGACLYVLRIPVQFFGFYNKGGLYTELPYFLA